MPSTNSHKPGQTRYREIEQYLRTLVEGAGPGDHLPSEAELCERFSVSRMTVRQALQELTNDGLVERRQGRTHLRRPPPRPPAPRRVPVLHRGDEPAWRAGHQPPADRRHGRAAPVGDARPRARPDSQVVRVVRVRLADGVPVALEDAALVHELATSSARTSGSSLHGALARRGVVATPRRARSPRGSPGPARPAARPGPQSALLVGAARALRPGRPGVRAHRDPLRRRPLRHRRCPPPPDGSVTAPVDDGRQPLPRPGDRLVHGGPPGPRESLCPGRPGPRPGHASVRRAQASVAPRPTGRRRWRRRPGRAPPARSRTRPGRPVAPTGRPRPRPVKSRSPAATPPPTTTVPATRP